MPTTSYHHGDLRRALLTAAAESIAESGPAALSMRELSRRAGVSHAAPTHHFRDKAGLLTALAADGFDLLAEALSEAATTGDLLEIGIAYVRFAQDHRGHFEVMFRPDLYHADDPAVAAARTAARETLTAGVRALPVADRRDEHLAVIAAWSIVHGFSALWLGGGLREDLGSDAEAAARRVIRLLFAPENGAGATPVPPAS